MSEPGRGSRLGSARGRSARRSVTARLAGYVTAFAILASAAAGFTLVTAAPVAAAVQGCGYADTSASNGNFARTTCWFDFSTFNETTARTAPGQAFQVTLTGGYVATFTAKVTDVAGFSVMHVAPFATPLATRFAFGTNAYRGVPGKPALYSLPGAGTKSATLTFSNIKVVDSGGNPVSGFSFVAADTEDNVSGESFRWTADQPINELERLAPNGGWGCKAPVGLGTTTVSCAGTGTGGSTIAGGKSTALIVGANSPSTFATQWITGAQSGIAIGIQTANLTLTKQVNGRINPADSFDVSVHAPAGVLQATATTGTATTATTGALNVLPNGGAYTLSEAMTAGSPSQLTSYLASWTCSNGDASSATVLPSGTGPIKTVSPAIGDDITCTITNTAIHPGLSLVKSATPSDAGHYTAGQPVNYQLTLTNTGDVPLTSVTIDDSAFSGTGSLSAITCPASIEPLDPGEQAICTASYTLTQADVDAGTVTNTAAATATTPTGAAITTVPSGAVIPINPGPAIALAKSADPTTAHEAGDPITYTYRVTNSGNVTLSGAAITETAFSGTGTHPAVTCPPGSFVPGQSVSCTASYTLTQADADAGSLTNTATATATAATGPNPISDPATATVTIVPAPALSLVKSVTPNTVSAVGDTVTYSYTVTNSGNVTLTDLHIAETLFDGTGTAPAASCPAGPLAPTATVTCTASYGATQADLDAGSITNTATASATPPGTTAAPVSNPSSATVTATAAPALTIVKSSQLDDRPVAGETITYSFVVTNTGNVTLSDIVVDDTAFSGTGPLGVIRCPTAPLPPAGTVTCVASYTLTQPDLDAGQLTNTATATASTPRGDPVTSAPSDNVQSLTPAPALSLVKSASPAAPADFHAGEQITYSFVVTNTGNVTITGLAVVEGNFSGTGPLPDPICPAAATSLAPGTQTVCTSTYTVTQPDIDAGFITNTATATGTPPNGGPPVQTQASTARVPEPPHPAATLVKAVDVHTLTHAGQIVNYSFTVTNAGNTSLTRPTINESTFTGHGALTTPTCPASPTTLLPGQKIVCTASYTVVADDLTGQQLTNTATATTTPPGGSPLTSDPSTARVADVASTGPAHDPLAATGPTHLWNLTALGFALIVAGVGLRVRRRRTGK